MRVRVRVRVHGRERNRGEKGKKGKKEKEKNKPRRREGRNRFVSRASMSWKEFLSTDPPFSESAIVSPLQEAVMSMDGSGKAGLGCKPWGFSFPSEALVGKPRKHTGASLERIRDTSRRRERQSRRLISRRQGRVLERVAMSFSRRPSWPRDGSRVSRRASPRFSERPSGPLRNLWQSRSPRR